MINGTSPSQSTVLLKKRRQTEPLSLPSVSGASKLQVEGKCRAAVVIGRCQTVNVSDNHFTIAGKEQQNEPLLSTVGTRTLPRQRKTVGAIGFGHIDASAAAAEDGNDENKEFLSSSSNSHNLPYV